MTDELQPTIDGKPLDTPDPNKGIELDKNGDPIRQGSLMNERQSYERVIEGLKIASDAAMHMASHEPGNHRHWNIISNNLDQVRRACVQQAGLGLVMREKSTEAVRGDPMAWKNARLRLREGLVQAAGGMRQLATCFRGDLWWSVSATEIEKLELKLRSPKRQRTLPGLGHGGLILPPGYH